jgi:hypothetical protein
MMVRGPRTFFGKTPFITFWVSSMSSLEKFKNQCSISLTGTISPATATLQTMPAQDAEML